MEAVKKRNDLLDWIFIVMTYTSDSTCSLFLWLEPKQYYIFQFTHTRFQFTQTRFQFTQTRYFNYEHFLFVYIVIQNKKVKQNKK